MLASVTAFTLLAVCCATFAPAFTVLSLCFATFWVVLIDFTLVFLAVFTNFPVDFFEVVIAFCFIEESTFLALFSISSFSFFFATLFLNAFTLSTPFYIL